MLIVHKSESVVFFVFLIIFVIITISCNSAAYIVNVFFVFMYIIQFIFLTETTVVVFIEFLMSLLSIYMFKILQSQHKMLTSCCWIALLLLSFICIITFFHHDKTIYKILNSNVVISKKYYNYITYWNFSHFNKLLHLKVLVKTQCLWQRVKFSVMFN